MTVNEKAELIKALVRAIVTIIFSVVWVVRVMEQGVLDNDAFTYFTGGMLVWYFGESLVGGFLNRFTTRGEVK